MNATDTRLVFRDCTEGEVTAFALQIASSLGVGSCILLSGDLGAGKTFFAKQLIRACCGDEVSVTSPTFSISQSYQSVTDTLKNITLWHYDLYRLEYVSEIEETGLTESLEYGVTLVEWPQIASVALPDDALHITFAFGSKSHYRDVIFSGDTTWIPQLSRKS